VADTAPDAHDGIELLTQQHTRIRQLFDETLGAVGPERADAFYRLRRLLAVHEAAEEQFIHPRARWVLHDGDPIANTRLSEEVAAKQSLVDLEQCDPDGAEFTEGLRRLRADVSAHAEAEEQEEFAKLGNALDDPQLRRLSHLLRTAEALAPTQPHPDLALGGENAFGGSFVTLFDRARDLFSRPSAND
jgi:hemerythrin superfamily protein